MTTLDNDTLVLQQKPASYEDALKQTGARPLAVVVTDDKDTQKILWASVDNAGNVKPLPGDLYTLRSFVKLPTGTPFRWYLVAAEDGLYVTNSGARELEKGALVSWGVETSTNGNAPTARPYWQRIALGLLGAAAVGGAAAGASVAWQKYKARRRG